MAKKTRSTMLISGMTNDETQADWQSVAKRLKGVIESMARSHPKGLDIVCGMRPGAELVAGRAAIAAKRAGYDVRVVAYEEAPGEAQALRDEAERSLKPTDKVKFANMSDYVRANADEFGPLRQDFDAMLVVCDENRGFRDAYHEAVRDGKPVFEMDTSAPELPISKINAKSPTTHIRIQNIPGSLIRDEGPRLKPTMSLVDADGTRGNGRDTFVVELDKDMLSYDDQTRRYTIDADVAAFSATSWRTDDTPGAVWSVGPETINECLPATLDALRERTAVIRAARSQEAAAERSARKLQDMDTYSTSQETFDIDRLTHLSDRMREVAKADEPKTREDMRKRLEAFEDHNELGLSTSVGDVSLKERTEQIVETAQANTDRWNEARDAVFENLTAAASSMLLKETIEMQTLAAELGALPKRTDEPSLPEEARKNAASKVLDTCAELRTLLVTKGLVPKADGTTEPESPSMRAAYQETFSDKMPPEDLLATLDHIEGKVEQIYGAFEDVDEAKRETGTDAPEATEEKPQADATETKAPTEEAETQDVGHEATTRPEQAPQRSVRIEPTLWGTEQGGMALGGSRIFVDEIPLNLPHDSRMCELEPYETLIPTNADKDVVDYLAKNDLIVAESMVGKATVRAAINLEKLMQQENSGVERMLDLAQEVEDQRSASTQMTSPQRQEQTEKSTEALHESTPQAATTQDTRDITDN